MGRAVQLYVQNTKYISYDNEAQAVHGDNSLHHLQVQLQLQPQLPLA